MTSEIVPRTEGIPATRGTAVGVGTRAVNMRSEGRSTDDVAHLDRVLMGELSTLNSHLGRYVLRHYDAEGDSAEPTSVADERALADSMTTAADAIRARAERRQRQEGT